MALGLSLRLWYRDAMNKHEVFVRAWQASNSLAGVATELGLPLPKDRHALALQRSRLAVKASRMRAMGIPLKYYGGHSGAGRIDVDALKEIVGG